MPFSPKPVTAANDGGTSVLNATAASSAITLPAGHPRVRIFNAGPNTAFVELGPTAYVPTGATPGTNTGSIPIAAGAGSIPLLLDKAMGAQISAICAAAQTAALYCTVGSGDATG